jgi:prevent-host-death family protein
MNISSNALVSNSDMIKNYKSCREKAERLGKIVIFKNNQPDAVLLPVDEFERLSIVIDYLDSLEEKNLDSLLELYRAKRPARIAMSASETL